MCEWTREGMRMRLLCSKAATTLYILNHIVWWFLSLIPIPGPGPGNEAS